MADWCKCFGPISARVFEISLQYEDSTLIRKEKLKTECVLHCCCLCLDTILVGQQRKKFGKRRSSIYRIDPNGAAVGV